MRPALEGCRGEGSGPNESRGGKGGLLSASCDGSRYTLCNAQVVAAIWGGVVAVAGGLGGVPGAERVAGELAGSRPATRARFLMISATIWAMRGEEIAPVRVTRRKIAPAARVRDQFDDLHAKHVLDRWNDVHRASHIALYALYLLPSPPDRAPDKRVGRCTDINRESQ